VAPWGVHVDWPVRLHHACQANLLQTLLFYCGSNSYSRHNMCATNSGGSAGEDTSRAELEREVVALLMAIC
jgi:hypothetical protein